MLFNVPEEEQIPVLQIVFECRLGQQIIGGDVSRLLQLLKIVPFCALQQFQLGRLVGEVVSVRLKMPRSLTMLA